MAASELSLEDYANPDAFNRALDRALFFSPRKTMLEIDTVLTSDASPKARVMHVAKAFANADHPKIKTLFSGGLLNHFKYESMYRQNIEAENSVGATGH